MRLRPWTFSLFLAVALGLVAAVFFLLGDRSDPPPDEPPAPISPVDSTPTASPPTPPPPSPPATSTSAAATSPSPTGTATPTATPSATPTPAGDGSARVSASSGGEGAPGRPARCQSVATRGAGLVAAVEGVMTDYEGVWGLALIDLDCASSIVIRPRHSQYPASAGKIVILVAALRAVQDGLLEFEAIEENLQLVLYYSLDKNTDEIAELITPEQVGAVMVRAGVSPDSYLHWHWRDARFTAHDLALVWASILHGEQLDERWTAHLLQLASEAVIPEADVTFPTAFGVDGFQYGQKAGYWKPEEDPDFFVAAGYIRPEDGAANGFAFAFLLRTWEEDHFEPQRRAVFPLVRDFVVGEVNR